MTRLTRQLVRLLVVAVLPGIVAAQDSASVPKARAFALRGRSFGATLDRYLVGGRGFTALTFRGITLDPGAWSAEFGFGLVPDADEHCALTMDLGTAYNVQAPGSLLLVKAGATGIFALGEGGTVVGAYAGAGLLVPLVRGAGLRLEGTRRWYLVLGPPPVWLLSVGLTSIPLRR
jgi:hypothetical protein